MYVCVSSGPSRMKMHSVIVVCVGLVCLLAMLADRTEGHITFFSPKEMIKMQVGIPKHTTEEQSHTACCT